jgi:phosphatidylserine/phosphatidylglycerophosphate/cardiolipin synthase-like enzyme
MVENVAKLVTDNPFVPETEKTKVKKALARFSDDELIKGLNAQVLPSISWNHAKLLVVNGRTLMTGGGNYWNEYADNQSQISDLQCKVKGNVALSAHAYCDYFWQ